MPNTQHAQRKLLYKLLGDLPARNRKISARTVAVERRENYVLEKLVLDLNGIEPVPAYFIKPSERGMGVPPMCSTGILPVSLQFPTVSSSSEQQKQKQKQKQQDMGKMPMPHTGGTPVPHMAKMPVPRPVVLYNHAHGGNYVLGKDELLAGHGSALQSPPYADELARMGCCALCIDHWAFGERRGRTEGEIFREMLWRGQVMWGMMMYDTLRAVDYLRSRDDVDGSRIATLGISMGSTLAWWAAALDERIKVTVDICCMSEYEELIKTRALETHSVYYFVPGLLTHFTTSTINELIAPRPHLCLAGNFDRLTPPSGLDIVDRNLRKAYKAAGAPDAWKMLRYETGHFETADMRREIIAFLRRWL